MRILLVITLWIVIISGLLLYLNNRDESTSQSIVKIPETSTGYQLQVTTSFLAEQDPFALKLDTFVQDTVLHIKLNGKTILNLASVDSYKNSLDSIPLIDNTANELYVECSPPMDNNYQAHAARLIISKSNQTLLDTTCWSEPGNKLISTIIIKP
jgi:hypothetical protein